MEFVLIDLSDEILNIKTDNIPAFGAARLPLPKSTLRQQIPGVFSYALWPAFIVQRQILGSYCGLYKILPQFLSAGTLKNHEQSRDMKSIIF
jgi:hypothetical protein